MPEFSYIARDSGGQVHRGVEIAAAPAELAHRLRGSGWIVLELREAVRPPSLAGAARWANPMQWLPATNLDVELGLQQLATMLRSGLTLLAALRTAAEQSRRPAMARVWQRVGERIQEGTTFADALENAVIHCNESGIVTKDLMNLVSPRPPRRQC